LARFRTRQKRRKVAIELDDASGNQEAQV